MLTSDDTRSLKEHRLSSQYYNMTKYETKMNMIRTGESMNLVDDGGYDPNADLAAHSNSLRVSLWP